MEPDDLWGRGGAPGADAVPPSPPAKAPMPLDPTLPFSSRGREAATAAGGASAPRPFGPCAAGLRSVERSGSILETDAQGGCYRR